MSPPLRALRGSAAGPVGQAVSPFSWRALRWLSAPLLLVALASSCSDDDPVDVPHTDNDAGGVSGKGGTGGKPDAASGGAAGEAGSDAGVSDAPLAPLRLGVIASPAHAPDAAPGPLDEKRARLETIALGSRAISVSRRWDSLFQGPLAPNPESWGALQGMSLLHAGSDRKILLCVELVDRTLDARPAGSAAGWAEPPVFASLDALVDKVFATFGDELAGLSFGNELDRYLAVASAKNQTDLVALVTHAVTYAKKHPARPPSSSIGVTFGATALAAGTSAEVASLVGISDMVVASYYPVDVGFQARPPTAASQDLDALAAAFTADAGDAETSAPRPVWLQAVGYPSATLAGSSLEQQRAFYEALFQALVTRRERFPFVAVDGLNESTDEACSERAAALGAPGNPAAVALACSLGLVASDGTNKPARDPVESALAAFSKP